MPAMLWRRLLVLLMCCCGVPAIAEGPAARLTLIDGAAMLHIGARTVKAAQGLVLPGGTLIDTEPQCQLVRLEWADGSALDLGPDTHVMLAPPAAAGGVAPAFYLLRGWAKFSSPAPRRGWLSPLLDAAPVNGVAVVLVEPAVTHLFAEAGEQLVIDRAGGRRRTLQPGELVRAAVGRPVEVMPKPSAALLASMPRAFRDTLPHRFDSFKGREVATVPLPAPSYAVLQPWLVAEPTLRRDFPARFSARLAERDFHAALAANLRQHPEWAPLLSAAPPHGEKK